MCCGVVRLSAARSRVDHEHNWLVNHRGNCKRRDYGLSVHILVTIFLEMPTVDPDGALTPCGRMQHRQSFSAM